MIKNIFGKIWKALNTNYKFLFNSSPIIILENLSVLMFIIIISYIVIQSQNNKTKYMSYKKTIIMKNKDYKDCEAIVIDVNLKSEYLVLTVCPENVELIKYGFLGKSSVY